MQSKQTTPPLPPSTLGRAQELGSQLWRAAHDASTAIDRAVALELTHTAPDARLARLRAFGCAQDAAVLARRMQATMARVDEGAALVADACAAALAMPSWDGVSALERAEFARDVAQHVVLALTVEAGRDDLHEKREASFVARLADRDAELAELESRLTERDRSVAEFRQLVDLANDNYDELSKHADWLGEKLTLAQLELERIKAGGAE